VYRGTIGTMAWKSRVCIACIAGLVGADIVYSLVLCACTYSISNVSVIKTLLAPLTSSEEHENFVKRGEKLTLFVLSI